MHSSKIHLHTPEKLLVDYFRILSIINGMKGINRKQFKDLTKRYSVITLGCLIMSLGISLFLDANNVASGGVTGISIIINYLISDVWFPASAVSNWLNTGTLIIIINIPLIILGAVFFGKNFTVSTLYSTVVSSLMVELWTFTLKPLMPDNIDIIVSASIGGAMMGAGLGLIFRMGSTTGGTDILVKILRKKFRYIRTGVISMTIDFIIIAASAFIYKDFNLTCYTILSIFIMSMMLDLVLYGGNSAKMVYIITTSDKAGEIIDKILSELDIGATLIDGEGAYTGQQKRIIMCATKSFLYPKLRDVVHSADPQAFTIVTSAKEIYGEGYKNHEEGDL